MSSDAAEVLKAGHCMVGRDMLPVVQKLLELKAVGTPPAVWARFTRKHRLPSYSQDELRAEFLKLTGYPASVILGMAAVEDNLEGCRLAAHAAVLHANIAGAPVGGQPLRPPQTPSTSAQQQGEASQASGSETDNVSTLHVAHGNTYFHRIRNSSRAFRKA